MSAENGTNNLAIHLRHHTGVGISAKKSLNALSGIINASDAKAIEALKAEQINKVYLIAFTRNEGGNAFWKKVGWQCQDDRNYYDLNLNEANMTVFNE